MVSEIPDAGFHQGANSVFVICGPSRLVFAKQPQGLLPGVVLLGS